MENTDYFFLETAFWRRLNYQSYQSLGQSLQSYFLKRIFSTILTVGKIKDNLFFLVFVLFFDCFSNWRTLRIKLSENLKW